MVLCDLLLAELIEKTIFEKFSTYDAEYTVSEAHYAAVEQARKYLSVVENASLYNLLDEAVCVFFPRCFLSSFRLNIRLRPFNLLTNGYLFSSRNL
jgi:hypothetical protein